MLTVVTMGWLMEFEEVGGCRKIAAISPAIRPRALGETLGDPNTATEDVQEFHSLEQFSTLQSTVSVINYTIQKIVMVTFVQPF